MRMIHCLARLALTICAGLAGPVAAQQAERLDDYPTQLPLAVQGEGPWFRVPLPLALRWQALHPDLRDLRVFNAQGEALAYGFVEASARQTQETREHAVKWFPLRGPADVGGKAPGVSVQRSADGTVIQVSPEVAPASNIVRRGWLLDASGIGQPLDRLRLDWTGGGDGFQRFRIEASDDLQAWRSWGVSQVARLSFGGERIEQREIDLAGDRARYLRLTWESPREAPELTEATITSTQRGTALPQLDWSDPIQAVRRGDDYEVNLPASLPIERLRVSLYQPNTLAPVTVSALEPTVAGGRRDAARQPAWQPVARGLLYRLTQDGSEILNHEIELRGTPVRAVRVRVDARGGGIGDAVSFRVAARGLEMVFLARGTPPYTLAMGRPNAQSAQLPLGMLVPGYEPARLAAMGVAQATVPAAPRVVTPAPVVPYEWKKFGLWAVLLIGVGLLGWMAASLVKTQRNAQPGQRRNGDDDAGR